MDCVGQIWIYLKGRSTWRRAQTTDKLAANICGNKSGVVLIIFGLGIGMCPSELTTRRKL
ncbi:hypothetical protein CUMW_045260 [Citrus unshiu]|nr:hypothetical protein CUMW_045260 [Citrus unshiu]